MNIINEIDNYLLNREFGRSEKKSHYPSEVMDCRRKLYYRWIGKSHSNPISAGSIWKMEIGKSLEKMISEFLEKKGLDLITNQKFSLENNKLISPIHGELDVLFVDDGDLSGIEVKTSFGRGIVEIQKTQDPKIEHIAQVLIYKEALNIKKFYLIYVGRDNAYRTQFLFENINDKLCCNGKPVKLTFDDIIDRYSEVEKFVEKQQEPERDFMAAIKNNEIKEKYQKNNVEYKTDWHCRYCAYQQSCWEDEIKMDRTDNSENFS